MLNILLSQLLKINDPINQIYILSQIRQLIINNQDSKSFFRECKGFEKILFFLYSKFLNNLIKNTQQKTIQKDFFQQSNQVICSVLTLLSTAVSWDPFNTHHFFHYCDISSFIFKATFLQDEPETLLGILFSFALNDESLQSSFKSIKEKLALEDHTQKELKKYTFNKLKKLIKDFFSEKDTIVNPKILPLILSVQENLKSSWHRLSVFLIFISLLGNCISETNLIAFTNNEIPSIIIKRLFGNDSIISDHLERKLALKLIIKLCQNGLPTKDIFFLIQKFSEDLTKNRELASFLLHLFSQNQNPSHIQFNLSLHGYSYIEFSSLYKPFPPLEYYSMFFWVRFDMFDETLDTNILGIIDNRKKYICKLVIEKHSKHLLFQTSLENHTKFSFYKFKENQWYHIVLVHQKSKDIVSSNLSLFVNGQHIENIICPYPLINKENSFIQLFLGTPQELCAHYGQNKSLLKWSLSSFLIIEDILSENIIKLYYCLGPYYNNIYQKSSNNSVINSLELLNILLEKKAHCEEEKNVFISMIKGRNFTSTLYDKMLFYISNDSILNINSFSNWDDSGKINKKIIQTINKKINNDLVIFNKASPFSSYYITDQKRIGWFLGNPINVIVNNVQDSIYYIGGPILGLKLIENSKTPNDVICTTKLILSFIKNNKKNLEDMEKNYGYKILAKILKSKEKKALNVQLLNSILSFLGYDKIDPKNCVILNPLAYKFLILDFEIWKKANQKTMKLYMQQFLSFILKSSYAQFNIKCFNKIHIIKKIIIALKLDYIPKNAFPLFLITFKTLIKIYFTPEVIKMLTTYIIYSFYKEHEEVNYESKKPFTSFLSENKSKFNNDFKEKLFYSGYNSPLRKKAIYVLEILSDILCDSQNNSFIEQFSTVIADKWLLLLLSDENPKCVIYGLKILSRLIILKKSNYISKFSSKTHGFLFMKLYLKRWWNNISIWKIIFCLFFGMDILNIKENITNMNNFETFLEFLLKENRNVTKIFCFEVFDVILAMLEAGAHDLKLFQTTDIRYTKDDLDACISSSTNILRKRSNSLNIVYNKINKNNYGNNSIYNFKKSNHYKDFNTLFHVVKFLKNMNSSIKCFKEYMLSSYFIEKFLYIIFSIIFLNYTEANIIFNSENSLRMSNKNIIINTLFFKDDHIPVLWKLNNINNFLPFSRYFIETISHEKNISIMFLKSTKKNKQPLFFESETLNSSRLNNRKCNMTSIYEILFQLVINNIIDSIINPSKNYILELNIQIPSCFFGNQIYIESCILYTTLIKLHKIIQNQLNKLNEISVLSNINDFSNDCLNCVRKGHFFMCESLFKFLLCILNYVHKMNIKKQKKTYQQIFINIQECFHHVLFLQLSTLKIYNEEGKFQTFIEEILSHNHIILQLLTANQGFIAYFCYWLYILLFSKSYNLRIISINFWKLIAQQRSHELFSVFNQITPSDHSIINTFLNMCNFNSRQFLSWVNKNKHILDNTFFEYLNISWNLYVKTQLKNWKKIISLNEQTRRNKIHQWEKQITEISNIFIKRQLILSNWCKSIVLLQHKKFKKYTQDQIDLDIFLNSFWSEITNNLTEEHCVFASNKKKNWMLDFTEGRSRMRKKMKPVTDQKHVIQSQLKQISPTNQYKTKGNKSIINDKNSKEVSNVFNNFKNNIHQINKKETIFTIRNFHYDFTTKYFNETNDLFKDNKNKKILQNLEHGDCILEIYNICRINGLNAHEGLLLLGRNNLYFMNNYFLKSDGEITTIWDLTIKNERDLYVQLLSDKNISKEMFFSKNQHETKKWPFNQILSIYKRSFLFRDVGLELFFIDGQSFLITLSTKERELVYNKLISKLSHTNYLLSKNFLVKDNFIDTIKSQISVSKFGSRVINMFNSSHSSLKKWKNGKMSNFHYLMIINTLTGRTYNDLTQYPIFPWVLADYSSEELDLTNPKTFRDFSKPMGAQNPVRRNNFEKRFKSLQEMQDSSQPPFHYGTHYSSAMIVCSYLIRLKPFVDSYLLLQGGSFDHADRLFYSIEKAWLSSSQGNMTDVRELIPEFFYLPEFLVNSNNYNFGIKQENNEVIDSVILPPWAKGDPKLFIKKHREALECDYVSEHLNEWIDLIFGFKQQGELAIKATNIFHHLSYKGSIDIDKIEDPVEKMATIGIIYNFGQTPKQIFQQPHPKKNYNSEKSITTKKLSCVKKYEKNINSLIQAIMFFKENDFSIKTIIYLKELDKLIVCPSNRIYMLPNVNIYLQWDAIGGDIEFYNKENKKIFRSLYKLHSQKITCSYFIEPYTLITASNDCIIYIWSIIQGETIELKQKGCLRGHSKPIISLDSSKSFSIIVSGSEDGLAIEWDLNRICYLRTLEKSSKPIQCVSINDTNGDIATCSETTISIWTINGDLLLRQNIQFSQNDMIFSCKFYEGINNEWLDCDLIFTGHKSGIVQIWNILWETENEKSIRKLINVKTLQHYDFIKKSLLISEITALYPSGETRSLFTGDKLGNVYIWNMPDTLYKSHYLLSEKYNNCFICQTIFTIIDRKYNCHPCGAILCSNCTYQHPKIESIKLCINCISHL